MTDAVRVFETEREIPVRFKLELMVAADLPQLSEEVRDKLAAEVQAALDRLTLKAIYGEGP
jgi:hypothetical protein